MTFYDFILDYAASIVADAVGDAAAIIAGVTQAIFNIGLMIFYPIYKIFGFVIDLMASILQPMQLLIANLQGIYGDLKTLFDSLTFLPTPWIGLFLTLLLIVIALRVYSFIKDISIAGFKI